MKSMLTEIHQIEITSRCNLRCKYCVHPTMARAKEDMTLKTFGRSLELAITLARSRGIKRQELNIAGIGESTLHPDFINILALCLSQTSPRFDVVLATNGLLVTDELAQEMRKWVDKFSALGGTLKTWVSLHRPEKAGPAVEALKRVGLLAGISSDPALASVDWAGQLAWPVSTPAKGGPCPWIRNGWGFVAANGDVLTCCFDGSGVGKVGTVWDDPGEMMVKPYELCKACHLKP